MFKYMTLFKQKLQFYRIITYVSKLTVCIYKSNPIVLHYYVYSKLRDAVRGTGFYYSIDVF